VAFAKKVYFYSSLLALPEPSVIYYENQHFTAHFLDSTGSSWHHNGMTRSGALILQNPSQAQLASAIAAIYVPRG